MNGLIGALVFFLVLCIAALLVIGRVNEYTWDRFVAEHHCRITALIGADAFDTAGVGANGQVAVSVGSTPGKIGWTCDDGITYYR